MRKSKLLALLLTLAFALLCFGACAEESVPLQGFTLAKTETSLYVGETERIGCRYYPSGATNKNVFWNVADDTVARVDDTGLVTALKEGVTTLYAESYDGAFKVSCTVRVYREQIAANGIRILVNGEAADSWTAAIDDAAPVITAQVLPENASNGNYTIAVADPAVASLAADGTLTYNAVGSTQITAVSDDGNHTATLPVTVTAATARSMTLGRNAVYGAVGLLPVVLTPVFNNPNIGDKAVTYVSDAPAVAAVSGDGEVSFLSEGSAVITATHTSTGLQASVTVTVLPESAVQYISTPEELVALDTAPCTVGTLYGLKNDIDMRGVAFDPIGYDGGDAAPGDGRKFNSVFGGNGFAIPNLTISQPEQHNIGLFVYVGAAGNVRNLTLTDMNVTGRIAGTVAGCNEGVVENCLIDGYVNGSTVSYNGPICATNGTTGLITDCIAVGSMADAGTNYAVIGRNYGRVENCVVCTDNIPQRVLGNGACLSMLTTAYCYGCPLLSATEMEAYGYDGFSSLLWNVTGTGIPTLKRT